MSNPADKFSILNRNPQAGYKKPEPKPKVQRYRKGQGQDAVESDESDDDNIYPTSITHYTKDGDKMSIAESSLTSKQDEEERNVLNRRRQARRTVIVEENGSKEEEPVEEIVQRRRPKETQVVEVEGEEQVENAARRRALLREKLLEQEKMQEENQEEQNEEEMVEEEEEEEEEDDGEDRGIISMLKPVFVSKHEREINDKRIEEETALREEQERLKEKRKQEAKLLLMEATRREEQEENEDNLSAGQMPNDDDDIDEANQYEEWKIRELKRIKREREERGKLEKERAEIERRRRLTDAERLHENKILGSDDTNKEEKVQYKFMQKYYHKGAFYQDSDDPIFKRDYNLAVGEDMQDKSNLPGILQKRRGQFGMRGGTKYTHLTDQDTTSFDPQFRVNEAIQQKTLMKLGGYKGAGTLDKPTTKRR